MKIFIRFGYVFLTFAAISLLFSFSCSGSKDDSLVIDDEAFGKESAESKDTKVSEEPSPEEAEVLKLLGISKEEASGPADSVKSEAAPDETDLQKMEERIDNLQEEANTRNTEVANLRAELSERERRISDLQQELSKPSTPPPSQPTTSASNTFQDKYNSALELYNSRQYQAALQAFNELLSTGADNSLADNCQYWMGECYYAMRNYNQALVEFQKVFSFNNSNKWDDAQLKVGLCHLRLGNQDRAQAEFEKLLSDYPDSEYVSKARNYLAQL